MLPPIDRDPPDHREYRQFMSHYFSRSKLAEQEHVVRQHAIELIEAFVDHGRCDIMADLATPLTANALAHFVFNMDSEADRELMARATTLTEAIATSASPEAWAELYLVVSEFLQRRQDAPDVPDDLVSAVLSARVGDRALTSEEKAGLIVLLFNGGLDTTRTAISNIVAHLALRPDLEEKLRDPDWLARNLDEFLRLDTPVIGLGRVVTRDVTLGGQQFKAGDRVWVSYAAANRDPAKFPHPDELDFDRNADGHVAFGLGIHRCIGAHFARIQVGIAISELLRRITDVRLMDGAGVAYVPGMVRAPIAVPISFRKRGQ